MFFESNYPEIIDLILGEEEYKNDEDLYLGCIGVIKDRRKWLREIEWEKEYTGGLSQHDAKMNKRKIMMQSKVPYYINNNRYIICKKCNRLIAESFISEVDSICPTRGICNQCKKD